MKVNLIVPIIGDVNEYIGMPILDKMSFYKFDGEIPYKQDSTAIGVITKILRKIENEENVLIEGEIWDKFISVGFGMSVNNGVERLNSVSFDIK